MKKITVLLITLAIMLLSCKDDNGNEVAVELNIGNITISEFEKSMLENVFKGDYENAISSSIDQRRDYLKQMAFRKIIIDLVSKEKIDTLKVVKDDYNKRLYEYSIINGLVQDSIRSKIYNEEDIKAHYESKKMKYVPKHILIDSKKHKEAIAKAKIDSIYARIMNGESFEELAKKYSDDIKTGVEGGKLGTVFLHDLVQEFREKLSVMKKGDISEPFKSIYGYHIVYLEDIIENKGLRDFDRERNNMISELDRIHSAEFNDKYLDLINRLFVKYSVEIDSVQIKTFVKKYQSLNKKQNEKGNDPMDEFTEDELERILSSYSDEKIKVRSIVNAIKSYPRESRPELKGYEDIRNFIVSRFSTKMLQNYTDELGYTKRPDFIETVRNSMYETYKEKLMNHLVRSRIPQPTEQEIKERYEKNSDIYKDQEGNLKDFTKVKVSIVNSIKSERFSKMMKEWEEEVFNNYGYKLNHIAIEKTFYEPEDDLK